jgi:predicted alpha/beta superfamily hydrolase
MTVIRTLLAGSVTLAILLSCTPAPLQAQDEGAPIVIGSRQSLQSQVLGETRPFWVYTPAGYEASDGVYPVVYLLDGNQHFHHTTGIAQFLAAQDRMPGVIVVAIPNTDRTRDLTPPMATDTTSAFPTAGGADGFLRFLGDELIPHIDGAYRTAPYRIIIGHSFGGLFAVYALLTRPYLFQAHIAISPSLWWDEEALLGAAERFFADGDDGGGADRSGFLYMTMGNEGGPMLAGAWGMARVLETGAPRGFRWGFDVLEQEDHGSVPLRSTYAGLELLFDGWRLADPVEVAAERGIAAVDEHFAALSDRFGYAIETPESLVNTIGYGLLAQDRVDAAIAVFERNVTRFPRSANVYDSLGDAYDRAGQWERARDSYAKAVARAREAGHPNLGVYEANLERMERVLGR